MRLGARLVGLRFDLMFGLGSIALFHPVVNELIQAHSPAIPTPGHHLFPNSLTREDVDDDGAPESDGVGLGGMVERLPGLVVGEGDRALAGGHSDVFDEGKYGEADLPRLFIQFEISHLGRRQARRERFHQLSELVDGAPAMFRYHEHPDEMVVWIACTTSVACDPLVGSGLAEELDVRVGLQ